MATEVLGARVHDRIGAQSERVLQTWRCERRVYHEVGAAGVRFGGVEGNAVRGAGRVGGRF